MHTTRVITAKVAQSTQDAYLAELLDFLFEGDKRATVAHLFDAKLRKSIKCGNFYDYGSKSRPHFYKTGKSVMCAQPDILNNVYKCAHFAGRQHAAIYSPVVKTAKSTRGAVTLWPKDTNFVALAKGKLYVASNSTELISEIIKSREKFCTKVGTGIVTKGKMDFRNLDMLVEGYGAYIAGNRDMSEIQLYERLEAKGIVYEPLSQPTVWKEVNLDAGECCTLDKDTLVYIPELSKKSTHAVVWCIVALCENEQSEEVCAVFDSGVYGDHAKNKGLTTFLSNRACLAWRKSRSA